MFTFYRLLQALIIFSYASKVEGAVRRIEVEEVRCTINHMEIRKARGPSGIAIECLRLVGLSV